MNCFWISDEYSAKCWKRNCFVELTTNCNWFCVSEESIIDCLRRIYSNWIISERNDVESLNWKWLIICWRNSIILSNWWGRKWYVNSTKWSVRNGNCVESFTFENIVDERDWNDWISLK